MYQNACVVFDDKLDSNQKFIDSFFTRGRHNDFKVSYLSQSYFDLPKRNMRTKSNVILCIQQTLKHVEHFCRDIAGFNMSYDKFKQLGREARNEKYIHLILNRLEEQTEVSTRYVYILM